VVVINGARQVGKSTLAQSVLHQQRGGVARFLDEPLTRAAAEADPMGFLRHDALMLIDEVQRVPDLWLAIKYLVDREPRPGQFLLTGSARLLALPSLQDALPGRSETIELFPLSQGEIDDAPDGFVDAAFAFGSEVSAEPSPLRRSDYLFRIARGGFPESWRRDTPRRRQRFFESYIADLLGRDVRQLADIEKASEMRRLMSMLAARAAGILNLSRFAGGLNISAPTARNYVEILEAVYLLRLIPAWSANLTSRAVAAPKVVVTDSGLATYLTSGSTADSVAGGLFENFVIGELARQLTWSRVSARLYHYRDRDMNEVDALLEDNAGKVVGVEVKAAETVRASDFRGLRHLQRRLGPRFVAGFVCYTGAESFSFGPGLACLPISALWTTPAPPS
jgi:predicted AAA+ superfamily ATPase